MLRRAVTVPTLWALTVTLVVLGLPSSRLDAQTLPFVRGDSNSDGLVQISDAVFTLSELFDGGTPTTCPAAADANSDGANDISDAIYVLTYLFAAGAPPSAPFPDCGVDPAPSGLSCTASPCPPQTGTIETAASLEWGIVDEGDLQSKPLTIRNVGPGPLAVSVATFDNPAFSLTEIAGAALPLTLQSGEARTLTLFFLAPPGTGGSTVRGVLELESDDPAQPLRAIELSALVAPPSDPLVTTTAVGASVAPIDAGNCASVGGTASFAVGSLSTDTFRVRLTDSSGLTVESTELPAPSGLATVAFGGIDACLLGDGVITVEVLVTRDGSPLSPAPGTPTVKNTSPLTAPILDPIAPVSVLSSLEVCGSAPANTTVSIAGGASVVSVTLDASTTTFCLTVPLRLNTQNVLIASATSNVGPLPRPVATAAPVSVAHVDPSSVAVADAASTPLTPEEIEELVDAGIIDLDDPDNFSVSMFTVVLTIGSFPVTITQPVPVPTAPGVGYGGSPPVGGSTPTGTPPVGGWIPPGDPSSPVGNPNPSPPVGCLTGCSQVIVISTPTGETIPGVIIIDGRIRILREFFQVTIALFNSSSLIDLVDMNTSIVLPAGLTPIAAGIGEDLGDVSADASIEEVFLGTIEPGETGVGQYVIRGDVVGTHAVEVTFDGFLGGAALAEPFPVSGSAATTVEVQGPPDLAVTVSHPSVVGGPDVTVGQIYELIVEITNLSAVPALYASLEMFVGGDAILVDAQDNPIPDSVVITDLGHIQPGQSVLSVFRVQSLVEGEIIACQGLTAENISLTVDTGPDGTECAITTAYPADFVPLPADLPPIVLGVSPEPGAGDVPVTTSIFTTFTPQASCLLPDVWSGVITAPIDPLNPGAGLQIVSANLVQIGTFYLEELDALGNPIRHIPLDLTLEDPPAGGTTIATQRLGLSSPQSQFFLSPNSVYRATLVGGAGGVCSLASGEVMENDYVWTFSTDQTCDPGDVVTAVLATPSDGAIDVPLNTAIVVDFDRRMNPGSFSFDPSDLAASSVGFYAGGSVMGDELVGGIAIAGTAIFSALNERLTYTPAAPLPEDTTIWIRLTSELEDVCGNPVDTPPSGVSFFSFQTPPPDVTAPDAPVVNPLPALTNLASVQVTGSAEPLSIITVSGGAFPAQGQTGVTGLFSVAVSLAPDTSHDLTVFATDASDNTSPPTIEDSLGDLLTIARDSTPPSIVSITPAAGAIGVEPSAVVTVQFDEPIQPGTVNDLNFRVTGAEIAGTFALVGDSGFTFTPNTPLPVSSALASFLRTGGVRDLAGNSLAEDFTAPFTTVDGPAPIVDTIAPSSGAQGATVTAVIQGTNLTGNANLSVDGEGVTAIPVGPGTGTTLEVQIVIAGDAPPGSRTITLTTAGGSDTVGFTVIEFVPPPTISAVTPNAAPPGVTIGATVQGTNLTGATLSIDGTGVTLNDLGTGDAFSRDVELVIDPGASLGVRTITATTAGGSATGAFEVVANAITTSPALLNLTTRATVNVSAQIPLPAGVGGVTVSLSSNDPSVVSVPSTVFIAEGTSSANFVVESFLNAGSATIDATAPGYDPAAVPTTVVLREFIVTSPFIGLDQTVAGTVTLDAPAPTGGATFTLASSDPGVVAVSPSSLTIPAGQTSGSFDLTGGLSVGFATLTVDGTADGYTTEDLALTITDRVISLPGTEEVALDTTFDLPIGIAPDPAPPGGLTISIASSDPSTVEVLTPTVTIPEGSFTATLTARSLTQTGTATITATEPTYAPDATVVSVTTELRIAQSFVDVPAAGSSSVFIELLSGGEPYLAPVGGITVNLSVDDPACVATPASIVIPEGATIGTAIVSDAALATLPCTTTLTASSSLGSDTVPITVGETPDLGALTLADVYGAGTRLGEGLQFRYRCSLATGAHGGVTLQLQTSDPTSALLSPAQFTPGTPVIEVTLPDGATFVDFYVQGVPGASGGFTVTAQQSRFEPDTVNLEMVAPAVEIISLSTTYNVTSQTAIADDAFAVRTGILNPAETFFERTQQVRAGDTQAITLTTSDPAVASLLAESPAQSGATIDVTVFGGSSQTPSSIPAGSPVLTFPSPITGTTDITATAPGFSSDQETVSVTIEPAELLLQDWSGAAELIGGGLQAQYRVNLTGSDHGGVTVTVTSSDPSRALVALDAATAGSASVDRFVPDGQSSFFVHFQGVAGATGVVSITASEPSFVTASVDLTIVDPALDIQSLSLSQTTTTAATLPDDPFRVRIGRTNAAGTSFAQTQSVAPGNSFTLALTTSDAAVGELVTTAATGSAVTTTIVAGQSHSPSSVAAGGVAVRYDPPVNGSTIIEASIVGGAPASVASETVTVTVNPASISIVDWYGMSTRLGAGLQARYRINLSGPDHGGVTLTVTSSDPTRMVVANDPLAAGGASTTLFVADGSTITDVWVEGVVGSTGSVTLTAAEASFTDGTFDLEVVAPGFDLTSLSTNISTTTASIVPDDPFRVRVGPTSASGTFLQSTNQTVSPSSGPLTITLDSSDPSVGQLETNAAGPAASVTVTIPVGESITESSVAAGGAAMVYDPPTTGTTVLSATAPGFDPSFVPASELISVTVDPASLSIQDWSGTASALGGGLQGQYRVLLSGADHGGVTVTLTSDNDAVLRTSELSTTPGSGVTTVFVPDGSSAFFFYAQGVFGATGTATITASNPAFTDGTQTITVVEPVLDLQSVTTNVITDTASTPSPDSISVRAGVSTNGMTLTQVQSVSGAGAISVDLSSSDVAIAQLSLNGSAGAAAVTATIPVGSTATTESITLTYDPPTTGVTTIEATSTGFVPGFPGAQADVSVTVNPASLSITDVYGEGLRLGGGLQSRYRVNLSGPDHGGVTVTLTSSDPLRTLVSDDPLVAGGTTTTVFVPDGSTTLDFWTQGVGGATGSVTVTASEPSFTSGSITIDLVQPVLQVISLTSSIAVTAPDDNFQIRAGILNPAGTGFEREQEVAPSSPVQVNVVNTMTTVADLVTFSTSADALTVEIPVNQTRTPNGVGSGGIAFRPTATGTTTITASAIDFGSFFGSSQTVEVTP